MPAMADGEIDVELIEKGGSDRSYARSLLRGGAHIGVHGLYRRTPGQCRFLGGERVPRQCRDPGANDCVRRISK